MQDQVLPTDAELTARAEEMLPSLLHRISLKNRKSKARLWGALAGSGVAILGIGTLIGATVLAPVANPGAGELYANGVFKPAAFAISCYSSATPNAGGSVQQYTSQSDINAAEANFGAACDSLWNKGQVLGAVGQVAAQEHAAGHTCGQVQIQGGEKATWQYTPTATGTDSLSISTGSPTTPANCGSTSTVVVPETSMGPVATCSIASNWVAVYPLGNRTASQVCGNVGLPEWNG